MEASASTKYDHTRANVSHDQAQWRHGGQDHCQRAHIRLAAAILNVSHCVTHDLLTLLVTALVNRLQTVNDRDITLQREIPAHSHCAVSSIT